MEQPEVHLANRFGGVGGAPGRRHDPSFGAQAGAHQADGSTRIDERAEDQSPFVQVHRSGVAANCSPEND